MNEGLEHFRIPFPAGGESAVVCQPGEDSFNLPTPSVPTQLATVLSRLAFAPPAMRTDQFDALSFQPRSQGVRIISAINDQSLGTTTPYRRERFFGERDFGRGCRRNVVSERKTRAVRHHHKLRALLPLGGPDRRAPFFAGMKVTSIDDSAQSSCSASSNSPMKARQMRIQMPCSSQSCSRRQQVEGLGYLSGGAFQGAPVHNTQMIPSTTGRPRPRRPSAILP